MAQLHRMAREMPSRFGFLLKAMIGVPGFMCQTLRKPFKADGLLEDWGREAVGIENARLHAGRQRLNSMICFHPAKSEVDHLKSR